MIDIDPLALYVDLRDEVIELTRDLPADDLARSVPLTPGWTIQEVVAHLCGLNADIAAGERTDLGSDEATQRQVSTRASDTIDEICDEWIGHADGMRALVAEEAMWGFRLSADLVVHLHDVQHALGIEIDRESPGSVAGGHTYGSRIVDRLVDVADTWVAIELPDGTRFEPASNPAGGMRSLELRATPYDVLRTITGRRSRAEVEALDWSDAPGDLLDVLSPYGPPRGEDAGV